MTIRGLVIAAYVATLEATIGHAPAQAAESCDVRLAATHNFRNGAPADATPLPDGSGAVYLRSGPRDLVQALYRYDLATRTEHALALPATLLNGAAETLSVEERARRERTRTATAGLADYALSRDGHRIAATLGGRILVIDVASGHVRTLPGTGWLTPHWSPDGRWIAAVRDNDLHVVDPDTGADLAVTQGGTDVHTHGLAEFAAEEELDRFDGFWWSPDSTTLLTEDADSTAVEMHVIADPGHPERPPVTFRYPRAGTANAVLHLSLVPRAGGPARAVQWDSTAFPYLARVVWPEHGALSLVVLDRSETREQVLAVDPATGATHALLDERDAAWVDVSPFSREPSQLALPHWLPDGTGFLWASDRSGDWRLELRKPDGSLDHAVTPAGFRFEALHDVADGRAVVSGGTDPEASLLYRVPIAGGPATKLATERGLHSAAFGDGHGLFADHESLADGTADTVLRDARTGTVVATLPSVAERPPLLPAIEWTTATPGRFDAAVLHPHGWHAGTRLPVVLSVYAGPVFKVVRAASRDFLAQQCLADAGAIVVSLDGHGTPGHGHDFERATKGDLIDRPLADQVAGLQDLGRRHPEMDMSRVAVEGWSFGGYFSAMATIRRPDVFRAGIAGAPVTDFRNYDTAYTERYLGLPAANAGAYDRNSVLTYAGALQRPLMIVHGLTDDNVYFVNTFELTQALLRAGKPYRLLVLPGTHMLADPDLRAAETSETEGFLREKIGLGKTRSSPP